MRNEFYEVIIQLELRNIKTINNNNNNNNNLFIPYSASEDALDRRVTTTAPLATSEPDFLDWEGGPPAGQGHYGGRSRHMSDDALLDRSDEVVSGGWMAQVSLK